MKAAHLRGDAAAAAGVSRSRARRHAIRLRSARTSSGAISCAATLAELRAVRTALQRAGAATRAALARRGRRLHRDASSTA